MIIIKTSRTAHENSLIAGAVILALVAGFFLYGTIQEKRAWEAKEAQAVAHKELIKAGIDTLDLRAQAISVYNAQTGEKIYGRNDEAVLPIASLAKIMTVLVALDGTLADQAITISAQAIGQEGDNYLLLGEKWNIEELAKFTLILSSNDGAVALSEQDPDFVQKMNRKAERLGLDHTSFQNVSGLDIDEHAYGAVSTASEINQLAIFAMQAHPEVFQATSLSHATLSSLSNFKHTIVNTDILIDTIPHVVFSKTGNTDLAGGTLAILFTNMKGEPFAITVLGSTTLGRFSDMEKIIGVLYNI